VVGRPGWALVRLNSSNDVNFGSCKVEEIECGLKLVDGKPKRFFTQENIQCLFRLWCIESMEEREIDRYDMTKVVWELCLQIFD